MSIKNRFILATLLLVATVLSAASGFLYFSERQHLQRQHARKQVESIRRLYTVCLDGVLSGHKQVTERYIEQISVLPELAYAACLDADGRAVSSGAPELMAGLPRDPLNEAATREMVKSVFELAETGEILDYVYRIQSHGKTIGWARMGYRVAVMERSTREAVLESLARFIRWGIPVASFLGALVGFFLASWLTKPIDQLCLGARRIGEGHLDHRIAMEREDELGVLAGEFDQMAAKLAELDAMRQDFLHMLTHDMRNPLSAMRGYAELMHMGARGPVTPEQQRCLEVIIGASGNINELIGDMLDLAKLEAKKMNLERRPVDLAELARGVVVLFQSIADKEKIALSLVSSAADAISGDERLLRRVITNLVSNALKFTPAGGGVVVTVSAGPAGFVSCSVADTGPGVPVAERGLMFTKFQQASNKDAVRKSAGTGLGLAICKSVVEEHGGGISAVCPPGGGTTITFTLPRYTA